MDKNKNSWHHLTTAVLVFLLLLIASLHSIVGWFRLDTTKKEVASVPAALEVLSNEAFAGTAFEEVSFNEKLVSIGDAAFKDALKLSDVHIPESIEFIGADAFPELTVIHGVKGSYAESWAKKNGYQFVVDLLNSDKIVNSAFHFDLILLMVILIPIWDDKTINTCRRISEIIKSMRPQDRPELYPINYRFP